MSSNNKDFEKVHRILSRLTEHYSAKKNCKYYHLDSRYALHEIPDSTIDCIISSPPYGSLKDYGSKAQMGYGQCTDKEYFPDISSIIAECFRISKNGASMWLILDTLKVSGKTVALPWEVLNIATKSGWEFQDLVVWDKGRSLPWSHKGKFRGVCEYILLFSKGNLNKFYLDSVRESDYLSSYWVKYPERYHPDGKAPSDLWHYPIPLQGSWAKKSATSRHFCPFPIELISRIIKLSSDEGDIIIDPFSGTGSVCATAGILKRKGIGLDTNIDFVKTFDQTGFDALNEQHQCSIKVGKDGVGSLRETIISLRILKYPKTLFSELLRSDRLNGAAKENIALLMVAPKKLYASGNKIDTSLLAEIDFTVLLKKEVNIRDVKNHIKECMCAPPLSKFGIKANLNIIRYSEWTRESYLRRLKLNKFYFYKNGIFHKSSGVIKKTELANFANNNIPKNSKFPPIISDINLNIALSR